MHLVNILNSVYPWINFGRDNPLYKRVNHFPNDKILDSTKLKASADDKLNIAKMTIPLFDKAENTMGTGENAGNQHSFPHSVFQSLLLEGR